MRSTTHATPAAGDQDAGLISAIALVLLPSCTWWIGLALCFRSGSWMAVAWVLGPGAVVLVGVLALEVAVLRLVRGGSGQPARTNARTQSTS